MSSSKAHRRKGHGETLPPLSKLNRIGELLQVQLEHFPQKELTPEEIARWEQDLGKYPIEAIEWAFDNWRRSGHFFPVPHDIISQCDAWVPKDDWSRRCNADCRKRHGKGYGENDILWLLERYNGERDKLQRLLTDEEYEGLLKELDTKRGSVP